MTGLQVEETRPCPYNRPEGPCPGHLEPELDAGMTIWVCTECESEVYPPERPAVQQDSCQLGVSAEVRRAVSAGPTFIGTIGRRPQ